MAGSSSSASSVVGSSSPSPLQRDERLIDLQHSESLAAEYLKLIKSSASPSNTAYLVETVAPLLVSGLSELLKTAEREAELAAQQRQVMRDNPALTERLPFNPVSWLASYLMQHNPRHSAETQTDVYAAYTAQAQKMLLQARE